MTGARTPRYHDRVTDRALLGLGPTGGRAIGGGLVIATTLCAIGVLGLAARALGVNAPALVAGEARQIAQVFAVGEFGQQLSGKATPFATRQMAIYADLTDAFARVATALDAVREMMIVAAMLTCAATWFLARRIGLHPITSVGAVAVVAVSPLVAAVQQVVFVENLAAPWATAGLALAWHLRWERTRSGDLLAVAGLVVATLTAPAAVVVAGVAAAVVLPHRGHRRVRLLIGAYVLGIGVGLGYTALTGAELWPGFAGTAGLGDWLRLDPVLATVAVLAAVAALWRPLWPSGSSAPRPSMRSVLRSALWFSAPRSSVTPGSPGAPLLRPVAVGFLVLAALGAVPGGPGAAVVGLAAPMAALLIAGVVEAAVRRMRARRPSRPLWTIPVVVVAVLTATAAPGWLRGIAATTSVDTEPVARNAAWLWIEDNLPAGRLITDHLTWVDMIRGGHPQGALSLPDRCEPSCPVGAWLVVTDELTAAAAEMPGGGLDEAIRTSTPVAVFGDGTDRVVINRPADSTSGADERRTWVAAGAALAASSQVLIDPTVADLLTTGRTDPRLLALLGALTSTSAVRIVALPEVAGEDAADQPRRRAVLSVPGQPPEELVLFFTTQRGVYRPDSAVATSDGVLVSYPPAPPNGLLTSFDTAPRR
jgi:hypothetical protein